MSSRRKEDRREAGTDGGRESGRIKGGKGHLPAGPCPVALNPTLDQAQPG